ncbi:MAG TPA: GNAT family N-acetyltransferase, partial [Ferruginibacter sp.]|nr:GNAT family N-acetyltransferase [Ferruginibacter sp.]
LLLQLNSDPEVVKYVHEIPLTTEEQARTIIKDIILPQYENKLGRWAIHKKENDEFIGWCGLKHIPAKNEIDLGYRLLKKEWGKGFATEAALHTLEYGFKELQLSIIVGKAHVDNIASLNILEKIGMKFINEEVEDGCPIKLYTITNPIRGRVANG